MWKSSSLRGANDRPSRNSGITSTPSRSRKIARPPIRESPFRLTDLKIGMGDEAMPDDRLHAFGKWCNARRVHLRNNHNHIALLSGVTGFSTNNTEDFGAASFCEINRAHKIDAHISLRISPTYGIDQQGVVARNTAHFKPAGENSIETFIIRARRKFRNIVNRCVGLDATKFAKIVYGVAAITRAASNAQKK